MVPEGEEDLEREDEGEMDDRADITPNRDINHTITPQMDFENKQDTTGVDNTPMETPNLQKA